MSQSLLFDVCIISVVDHFWKCSEHNAVQLVLCMPAGINDEQEKAGMVLCGARLC